jgi:hypothetical protein
MLACQVFLAASSVGLTGDGAFVGFVALTALTGLVAWANTQVHHSASVKIPIESRIPNERVLLPKLTMGEISVLTFVLGSIYSELTR